jgi:hypothetical protein
MMLSRSNLTKMGMKIDQFSDLKYLSNIKAVKILIFSLKQPKRVKGLMGCLPPLRAAVHLRYHKFFNRDKILLTLV